MGAFSHNIFLDPYRYATLSMRFVALLAPQAHAVCHILVLCYNGSYFTVVSSGDGVCVCGIVSQAHTSTMFKDDRRIQLSMNSTVRRI